MDSGFGGGSIYMKKKDNFRHIVKGYPFFTRAAAARSFFYRNMDCTPVAGEGEEPVLFRAIRDYLQEMKWTSSNSSSSYMTIHIGSLPDGQVVFYMGIDLALMKRLCALLPSPFFQFRGTVDSIVNPAGSHHLAFDNRRYLLKDLLRTAEEKGSDKVRQRMFCSTEEPFIPLSTSSIYLEITIDIILGWTTDGHSKTGLKLSLGSDFLLKLFGMEYSKDMTIVVGNGKELKCHRNIFAAHSPVFEAMLSPENGMKESKEGRIEMLENSEEGINQLLRYLYGFEITKEELTGYLAVELFKTAHQYELKELQDDISHLFFQNDMDRLTPDDILELYFHFKNVDNLKPLMDHVLGRMKRMPSELRSCERYKGLKRKEVENFLWEMMEVKEGGKRVKKMADETGKGVKRKAKEEKEGSESDDDE